jgi:Tfp pilus assembly protein PilX
MRSWIRRAGGRARSSDGFAMIIVMSVMLVMAALVVASLTTAIGDSHLSREDTNQKQAYFAALAGIQEYTYKLQANPDYWATCEAPSGKVPGESSNQSYKIELLVASTSKGATECSTTNPFTTMIESEGALTNTFRIKSTGTVTTTGYTGSATRSLVATFQVSGFLNYVYYTNYEQGDPPLYGSSKECEKKYYNEWSAAALSCQAITFTTGDAVNGPMHTNDAARVTGSPAFGRVGQKPADLVEINGGIYSSGAASKTCSGFTATFNTASGCFSTSGATLVPPPDDTSLTRYVEPQNEFVGVTRLELLGGESKINVAYYEENAKEELEKKEKKIEWPKNGLIYVKGSTKWKKYPCTYEYKFWSSDNAEEEEKEKGCGNVYVKGTYTKSLTVAGENDVIINGSVYPAGLTLGNEPPGTAVLGLIASHYVRVYHPLTGPDTSGGCGEVKKGELSKNGAGSLTGASEPWIYAGMLATSHSFVVDNYNCGAELGKLHVYGAIAQDYRGPVGLGSGGGGSGYLKDYKYDGRLAVDEPPYFLSPFKSGWKVIRQTAPTRG